MILYTPTDDPTHDADLFLGGSCVPEHPWRKDLLEALRTFSITIYSPERAEFPNESLEDPAYLRQARWEQSALAHSRAAVFWLDPKKPTSYASRLEIGITLGRERPCVIGCLPHFPGAVYLRAYAPQAVLLTYPDFCEAVLQLARTL